MRRNTTNFPESENSGEELQNSHSSHASPFPVNVSALSLSSSFLSRPHAKFALKQVSLLRLPLPSFPPPLCRTLCDARFFKKPSAMRDSYDCLDARFAFKSNTHDARESCDLRMRYRRLKGVDQRITPRDLQPDKQFIHEFATGYAFLWLPHNKINHVYLFRNKSFVKIGNALNIDCRSRVSIDVCLCSVLHTRKGFTAMV